MPKKKTKEPKENGEKTEVDGVRDPETGRFVPGNPGGPGRPVGSISIIGRIKAIFEEDPARFEDYVRDALDDPKLRAEIIRQIDGAPKQSLDLDAKGSFTVEIVSFGAEKKDEDTPAA